TSSSRLRTTTARKTPSTCSHSACPGIHGSLAWAPAAARPAPLARASAAGACPMPRLVPVTRTVLRVMLTMITISFACHAVVQAGRAGVARFGQVAVSSGGRFDLGGFRCLERWGVIVGEGEGCRAAQKKDGCRREREQGDRSADPQGPVEAA